MGALQKLIVKRTGPLILRVPVESKGREGRVKGRLWAREIRHQVTEGDFTEFTGGVTVGFIVGVVGDR